MEQKKQHLCPEHAAAVEGAPHLNDADSAERIAELEAQGYDVKVVDSADGKIILKRKRQTLDR